MAWFRCFIRGDNFPGELFPNQSGLVCFYATRFVNAKTPDEAKEKAMESLRETIVEPPGYTPTGNPMVFFEEVTEIPATKVKKGGEALFFAPMDS